MRAETAGLDWSLARPSPLAVADLGFRFVVRYVSPLGSAPGTGPSEANPKDLTAAELAGLLSAGLGVLLVFESTALRPLAGLGAGQSDGSCAKARAAAIGYPSAYPIFTAVDFPGAEQHMDVVLPYLDGFTNNVGAPSGPYGSFALVEAVAAHRPGWLYWQTAAWSNNAKGEPQLSAHAHLYQRNHKLWPDVAGTDENVVCSTLAAYGVTLVPGGGAVPSPPPAPTPVPAPPPAPVPPAGFDVRSWRAVQGDTGAIFTRLQGWANRTYPAYARITPVAPSYGPQTAAFLREFAHRSGIPSADGGNVGPKIAAALYAAGFRG